MKSIDTERAALFGLWAGLILLFGLWPGLDLWFSAWFYTPNQGFVVEPLILALNDSIPWLGRALLILGLAVLGLARLKRSAVSRRAQRNAALLVLSLVFGLGLLVHEVLKNQWGRARPQAIERFGGSATFTSPLRPAKQCQRNCSFVSGHAATGFALIAVGLLGPTRRRRHWLLAGIISGLLIGLVRIAVGGHFLSDILFCLAFMWSANLLIRWAWIGLVWHRRQRANALRHKRSVIQ
jgi:lipid A 4'-phosphatase